MKSQLILLLLAVSIAAIHCDNDYVDPELVEVESSSDRAESESSQVVSLQQQLSSELQKNKDLTSSLLTTEQIVDALTSGFNKASAIIEALPSMKNKKPKKQPSIHPAFGAPDSPSSYGLPTSSAQVKVSSYDSSIHHFLGSKNRKAAAAATQKAKTVNTADVNLDKSATPLSRKQQVLNMKNTKSHKRNSAAYKVPHLFAAAIDSNPGSFPAPPSPPFLRPVPKATSLIHVASTNNCQASASCEPKRQRIFYSSSRGHRQRRFNAARRGYSCVDRLCYTIPHEVDTLDRHITPELYPRRGRRCRNHCRGQPHGIPFTFHRTHRRRHHFYPKGELHHGVEAEHLHERSRYRLHHHYHQFDDDHRRVFRRRPRHVVRDWTPPSDNPFTHDPENEEIFHGRIFHSKPRHHRRRWHHRRHRRRLHPVHFDQDLNDRHDRSLPSLPSYPSHHVHSVANTPIDNFHHHSLHQLQPIPPFPSTRYEY